MNDLHSKHLLLHDYSDPRQILIINRSDGSYTIEQTDGETRAGASGFAQLRTFGLLRCRRMLIALYVEAGGLRFRVDNTIFALSGPTLRTRLTAPFPFIRHFRIIAGDHTLFRAIYPFAGIDSWPDDGDLLTKVQSIATDVREEARFIAFWSGIEVVSAEELERGLEHFLDKHQEARARRTGFTP